MITLANIDKYFGKQVLLMDASFQLNPGEKVGLVGPNGSGKTTLFRMIIGEEQPDGGEVSTQRKLSIGYFRQDTGEMKGRSILDEAIANSGKLGELHHELEELQHAMADPDRADEMDRILKRFEHVQEEYQNLDGYSLEARAQEILHGLGFETSDFEKDVGQLSGGWKMRVAMAKVLLGKPEVLLMDEPTNHLDIESILWLEDFLRNSKAALLMTCHDRDFMNRVVSRVVEIDEGELVSYSGNYDFYEGEKKMRSAQQEAAFARQQAMFTKEQRFIDRFGKSAGRASQVQSRIKKLDKIEKLEPPRKREVVPFSLTPPPRSGEDVAILKGVSKGFGEKQIYDGFDFEIRRKERWCVMGANGAGKSTLLKMVAGVLAADAGTVKVGASVKMGYFAQQALDVLDPNLTAYEQIDHMYPMATLGAKRNLLGAFEFSGDEVDKPIRILSGGEKSRLLLAQMLFDPPNFLVLDEPTNHLDLFTKEMLIQTLKNYEGAMLFVSHDRTFLRGLANRVIDLSGGDQPIPKKKKKKDPYLYPGSYVEWVGKTGCEAPGVHR